MPIERQLRQEAGYGCCKCGHPIFQYHHILPYTEADPHYRPADMMVLCPNCHDEATQGVLKEAEQRRLKANPFNLEHGYASGQLSVEHRAAKILVGESVSMSLQGDVLKIDGESVLALGIGPAGDLRISVNLYDQHDKRLGRIVENVWDTRNPFPWDLDFAYRRLLIRRAKGNIAMDLDLRNDPPQLKGHLWRHGRSYRLGKGLHFNEGGGGMQYVDMEGISLNLIPGGGMTVEAHDTSEPAPPAPTVEQRRVPDNRVGRNDPCWCGSGKKFKKCHGAT